MYAEALDTFVRAVMQVALPVNCMACGARLITTTPYYVCDPCQADIAAHTGPRCARCDKTNANGICVACAADAAGYDCLRAPLLLTDTTRALLRQGRKRGRQDVWRMLCRALIDDAQARRLFVQADCVMPIPTPRQRFAARGLNPSAALAHGVARAYKLPCAHDLRLTRVPAPQSALQMAQRRRNMTAALWCTKPAPHTVVLIDDSVITGATLRAAARAVRQAGATRVFAVAVVYGGA